LQKRYLHLRLIQLTAELVELYTLLTTVPKKQKKKAKQQAPQQDDNRSEQAKISLQENRKQLDSVLVSCISHQLTISSRNISKY
jgi:hypothetical protein